MHPYTEYSKPDLNSFLSATMHELNCVSTRVVAELENDFLDAMTRAFQIFGRYAFRKFSLATGRRGPINKALFESWANVLQEYDLDALLERKDNVCHEVSSMLNSNSEYVRSLSAGTGSVSSVRTRFECAHNAVQEVLK
jgi:hypothetical protein